MLADKTDRMGIINHDQCFVLISQIADAFEIADDAVHREDAVSGDQLDAGACLIGFFELCLKISHVIVLITVSLCLAKTHAVNDRCVVELIGNHRVLRSEQCFKQTAVGIEAGGIKNGVIRFQKG